MHTFGNSFSLNFGLVTSASAEEMAPWWVNWKGISVYAILCLQWKNLLQDFLSEEIPLTTGWKAREWQGRVPAGSRVPRGKGVLTALSPCMSPSYPSASVSVRDENQTMQNALFNSFLGFKVGKKRDGTVGESRRRDPWAGDWAWESLTLSTFPISPQLGCSPSSTLTGNKRPRISLGFSLSK